MYNVLQHLDLKRTDSSNKNKVVAICINAIIPTGTVDNILSIDKNMGLLH